MRQRLPQISMTLMSWTPRGGKRVADRQIGLHAISGIPDAEAWSERIQRGLMRVSTITRLEFGYSFRSGEQAAREWASPPLAMMPVEYLTPAAEDRAVEVPMLLADRGQHRAPTIPDLLVAATADLATLTVLALDKDFDLIASVTGQPVERLRLP